MAKKIINTGTTDNDGTGDSLKTGAGKINDNFTEIYTTFGDGTNLTGGAGGGAQGVKGNTGSQGIQGFQGVQGRIGANFNVFATEANVAINPPGNVQTFLNNTYPNAGIGSAVIDDLTNHIWVYQGGNVWLDGGDTSGAQGIAGQYAAQGLQGTIGIQGVQGVQGIQGAQGVQGVQGRDGANAGQGTQGAFGAQGLQATQGAQGNLGIQGPLGIQGDLGAHGPQGVQGNMGYGAQGFQGIIGNTGTQGTFGQIGPTGNTGTQGVQGLQGLTGQGVQGSLGIQGGGGPAGNTGAQGAQGDTGSQGVQGLQGLQGLQGVQGHQGLQGLQGVQGLQGLSNQGVQGVVGEQGVQGLQGQQGVQGRDGANAGQGTQGVQGVQGLQGISNQGVQGKDGESAGQGTQGTIASQGLQGTIGNTGAQGSQGIQGNQGTQGTQGIVGAQVTAKTYTFTASGGAYYVDGVQQDTLYLIRGQKYIFDGSAASSHPLRLSTDSGNTSAYTSGYTVGASNTHTFVVPYDAPDTLYYYCTSHANMGGAIGVRDLTANDLQGTQGLTGAGSQGTTGGTGTQGTQGLQGISNQGVQGLQGLQGTQSTQGLQGTTGSVGVIGPTGSTGAQGSLGLQGIRGDYAAQGVQGATGSTGPQGVQGVKGTTNIVTPEDYGAIAKPVIEPETRTWYNAMSTKPKREHLRSMDMLVKRLKWTGIWNELDTLYVFASHNKSDSLINVKNPGTANLTETATATFTAGKGFTAGSNGRLATSVNFNTFASQYQQDSAHVGVFMLTDGQRDNSPIAGIADGTEDGYIVPHRADTDVMRARVNTSDGNDFTNTRSDGSFIISRNSSTALVAYRNGFQLGTATNTSEAVPSQPLEVLNVTGSDGSGTIAFLHTGDQFNESQARSFSWMMQEYVNEIEAGYDEGATVTTGMLDRTVGVVTNTTAMQNFINVAVGSTVGILGDETYLINDTLTLPDSHNLQGVLGKTTIRAHSDSVASESMNNERPVIRVGVSTAQTFGGKVDGLIVDYNIDRTTGIGSTTGGFELDTDGTAFALHNVQGGRYTNIITMSARKHGFDILGDNYNRSGTDGTYNQKLNLVSRDIYVDKIVCMGMGDDGFTTHGVEYITGGSVWGEFCRGTFSPRNSNAVEIDDYSRYINIKDMGGRFVHSVVEVKGHGDAAPAEHVYIGRIFAEHSTRGVLIRHLDHGDSTAQEGVSPFEGDVVIDNVYHRAPLVYHGQLPSGTSGSGSNGLGLEAQAGFIYGYDRVQIGNFTARCDGADNVITTQVLQIGGGGSNFFVNRIDISDFTSATQGLDLYGDNPGAYSMFNSIRIHNSGTVEGVDIGGNTDAVIGSYAITKTGSNGTTGIDGHSNVKLGQGFVSGYTTSTDVT